MRRTVEASKEARPGNAKVRRREMEFAPIKGRSTEREARKVQRIDDTNDRKLAHRYGVKFKG